MKNTEQFARANLSRAEMIELGILGLALSLAVAAGFWALVSWLS